MQSLGGRFVELPIEAKDAQDARGYARAQDESFYKQQRELLGRVVKESDVVITAAVIPGQEIARAGHGRDGEGHGAGFGDFRSRRRARRQLRTDEGRAKPSSQHGVTIIGAINVASGVPYHASQMYARNITAFLPT